MRAVRRKEKLKLISEVDNEGGLGEKGVNLAARTL